jgi:peptidoglycan/xylan/chitin deacetylase (PgdA/CDA1 family)
LNKKLKSAALGILSREPILSLMRRTKLNDRVVVLMYHELAEDDDETDSWTVVRKSAFIRQMEYLSRHFEVVTLTEALSLAEEPRQGKRPLAVVTFDDGYAGYVNVLLPIMQRMDLPVTVFISTSSVQTQTNYWYNRLMNELQGRSGTRINLKKYSLDEYAINQYSGIKNWMEIQRVLEGLKVLSPLEREEAVTTVIEELTPQERNGGFRFTPLTEAGVRMLAACSKITIGAHSHCHNILTQLTPEEAGKSIMLSKQLLESWSGRPVQFFAYPNGNYDNKLANAVREAGFLCSMTTRGRLWGPATSRFEIPRIGIGRYDSLDLFKFKTAGGLF